ncbi:hypothetical protein [Pseudomonas chlororaphis]|uniref:hypothetical protein n=1 Tax=Pseudomonas chlororaphis TaxID=587753 RepID=UPI002D79F873|nr:hypothetical protein [Pseudomonas chlororaphis]
MNLQQLHRYLGQLIEAGTPGILPVVFPGQQNGDHPQEVSDAMLISGTYDADPSPLALGHFQRTEACLLLSGPAFDLDALKTSHDPQWPPVDPPVAPVRV